MITTLEQTLNTSVALTYGDGLNTLTGMHLTCARHVASYTLLMQESAQMLSSVAPPCLMWLSVCAWPQVAGNQG